MHSASSLPSRASALAARALAVALFVPAFAAADPLPLTWQAYDNLHAIRDHAAVLDTKRDRLVVTGGYLPETSYWSFDLQTNAWTRIGTFGHRKNHSACYDPSRDAMFYYGGWTSDFSANYLDGARIDFATAAQTGLEPGFNLPGSPADFTLLLDRAHERLLVLGNSDTPPATVYSYFFSAGVWSSQSSAGFYPNVNVAKTAVIDAANDRVLTLAGGVHEMSLSGTPTWSALSPGGTAPPSLTGTAVMDSVRQRVLLFRDDMTVWALSLAGSPTWSQVFSSGTAPAARTRHTVTLDAERDRALLCGGVLTGPGTTKADVWAFDFSTDTWHLLLDPGSGPEWRRDHTAVRAAGLDALLVFGDASSLGSTAYLWPLAGTGSGTRLSPSGTPPSSRRLAALAWDDSRQRAYVFGGSANANGAVLGDLWSLSLSGSPAWTPIVTTGGPNGRRSGTAFWDPVRYRLIVVGGTASGTFTGKTDLWALSLTGTPTWQRLVADSTIAPLVEQPVAVYDSLRDRVVLVGLPYAGGSVRAWAFDLAAGSDWTDLGATGSAFSNTQNFNGTLDSFGDQVLLYGGILWANGYYSGELAALSLGASPAFTHPGAGNAPYARAYHTLTYDPRRYRTVMLGGRESANGGDNVSSAADLKFLQGDLATPALASLAAAEVTGDAARLEWLVAGADYATWRVERSIEQGEWSDVGAPASLGNDRLEFRDGGLPEGAHVGYRLVAIESGAERRMGEAWITVPARNDALTLSRVSLANGVLRYVATLPGSGEARLDVYDVSGRRLGGASLGTARGERQGSIALRAPGGAGVCFVRLSQGAASVTRKAVRLE